MNHYQGNKLDMGTLVKPDGVPLYVQTRKSLQDDIANNILVPGQKIPSEDELAIRFGISWMTEHRLNLRTTITAEIGIP